MNRQTESSTASHAPYVRPRHWNLEPLVFALCVVAAVTAIGHRASDTAPPQQATPSEPVRTLASADTR